MNSLGLIAAATSAAATSAIAGRIGTAAATPAPAADVENSGLTVGRQAIVVPLGVARTGLLEIPPVVQLFVERIIVALEAQIFCFFAKPMIRAHFRILRFNAKPSESILRCCKP